MDIRVDNNFQIFFEGKMEIINSNNVQKFMTLLQMPKKSLAWDENFGTDFNFLLELIRLDNLNSLKSYYLFQASQLKVNLWNIEFKYSDSGALKILFVFSDETIEIRPSQESFFNGMRR